MAFREHTRTNRQTSGGVFIMVSGKPLSTGGEKSKETCTRQNLIHNDMIPLRAFWCAVGKERENKGVYSRQEPVRAHNPKRALDPSFGRTRGRRQGGSQGRKGAKWHQKSLWVLLSPGGGGNRPGIEVGGKQSNLMGSKNSHSYHKKERPRKGSRQR